MSIADITKGIRDAADALTRAKVADAEYDRAMLAKRAAWDAENRASKAADKAIREGIAEGVLTNADLWRLHHDMKNVTAYVAMLPVMGKMFGDTLVFSPARDREALNFPLTLAPVESNGFLSDTALATIEDRLRKTIAEFGIRPQNGAYYVNVLNHRGSVAGVVSWEPGIVASFTAHDHDALIAPTLAEVVGMAHAHVTAGVPA